ncbi:MAG: arsenite efflux transporter metallochaperone ArsD [Bacteroidales bacterium]
MKTIEIFDPAMCCPTGLCGPNINPDLMRIAAAVQLLQNQGISIKRHNLRDEPQLYVSNLTVNEYLQEKGADGLPVVLVDGAIAISGEYPTNKQLTEWTGIELDSIPLVSGSGKKHNR